MAPQADRALDAARRLEAVYARIAATSMSDMPLYNDALNVEAIGFREDGGDILGIVITPWFMNLTLVPGPDSSLRMRPLGEKDSRRYPAGRFDFVHGELDGFGRVLTCSLYSPMFEFDDPAVARAAAEAALEALSDPENADDVTVPAQDERDLGAPPPVAETLDRRAFLRGEIRREDA
jgi:[NiFe] hydrogenase assembly HybE family chaperone